MGLRRFIIGILTVVLCLIVNKVHAQLSKVHYIPPLTSAEFGNANPESQYIYISTPNLADIPYTIKPIGQTSSNYITGVVSNSAPKSIYIGTGNGQLFIPSNQSSTVSNKGYIIEAEDIVYVSVRMNGGNGAQAGALVSKGLSALGTTFRIGTFTNQNPQNNYLNFVSVMASEDNTTVTFDDLPAGLVIKNYSGTKPVSVLLQEGESYVLAVNSIDYPANRDGLIGALVSSNKPIAVNCGSANGSFHDGGGRDFGIDQIVDLSKVGDEYIFVEGDGEIGWENVLIVAHENNTTVSINGEASPTTTINAGDYYLIEGNRYSAQGNLFVSTSKKVFAYQGVGATSSEANQGLFFVPPLSCENRGNVNNIANIEDIGSTTYTGGVTVVTNKGADVTINGSPIANFNTIGPSAVPGNPDYVTYKVLGLAGNIRVDCDAELYCAYFNYNGAATSGSFYSGFPSAPEINFEATFVTLGNCIPNITLSATNTHNFDSFQWYFDDGSGFAPTGNTNPDFTPVAPGRYKLIGIIDCTGLTLESVEVPVSYCPDDTDTDGIIDNLDIDNDNDGILNCEESKGNVSIDLTNTASPQLKFSDNSILNNFATGTYTQTSSSGGLNSFSGASDGTFVSVVSPANSADGLYKLDFDEQVNVKFTADPNSTSTSNSNESFIVRISPSSKNITLVDPDNRLLIDTNFDGIFESGVKSLSGSEIHFKINTASTGTTPFEFLADHVDGFSFIHRLSDINSGSTFKGQISLTCFSRDSDGDDIPDAFDSDSDNDGIPDIYEAAGSNYAPLSLIDTDLNGLDDIFDPANNPIDTDGDGVPDYLDLDSDNDGIYDLEEAGHGLEDLNFDGQIDTILTTIGSNGLSDLLETTADNSILNYTLRDLDVDAISGYIDSDSDGDGCADVLEAGFNDNDDDGILGNSPVLVNVNGLVTSDSSGYSNTNADYKISAPISVQIQPANTGVCINFDTILEIISAEAESYQWQESIDGTLWNDLSDNGQYGGTKSHELKIYNAPMAITGNKYRVLLDRTGNSCGLTSEEAVLTVHPLPVVTPFVVLKQCDNDTDGLSVFNLTEVNNEISTNAVNETFSYFNSLSDAQADINVIPSPTTYINKIPSIYSVWARVSSEFGCPEYSEIQLVVSTTGIPASFSRSFYQCDDFLDINGVSSGNNDDRDGVASFDFSSVTSEVNGLFPVGQQLLITYYRNEADALEEVNAISDTSNYRNIGYPDNQPIYIRVDSELDNDCLGFGPYINLYVEALPIAHDVQIERQCDDDQDGFFPFDTSSLETDLLKGQTNVTVNYIAQNGTVLPSPLPNPFLTETQTITIQVTNNNTNSPDGPCEDETFLEFIVDKSPIAFPVYIAPVCDVDPNDSDGIYDFDTSMIEFALLNGQTGMEVHYYDGNNNELSSPLPNPFTSGTQTISIEVINPINQTCKANTTLDLVVNPKPEFSVDASHILCLTDPASTIELSVYQEDPQEVFDFLWTDSNGSVLSTFSQYDASAPGIYYVTLTKTDGTGCSRTREIEIVPSEIANITLDDLIIQDDSDNNTLTVLFENNRLGLGDYEFSLDDEYFGYQDEGFFDHLEAGVHTLYVRDKNLCGTASLEFSVIGFPRFFTPNFDGVNDYWKVLGVTEFFYSESVIYIFDRYGKFLLQIDTHGNGWDGSFNGKDLPSTDYWFSAQIVEHNGNIRIRKGHFSLIRK